MIVVSEYKSYPIRIEGIRAGKDFTVAVYGGAVPHVGSVAMSYMGNALHEPEHRTCTEQLLSVHGHKEGELARTVATRLAKQFDCTVVVSCGIHYPNATKEDIASIINLVSEMTDEFILVVRDAERRV